MLKQLDQAFEFNQATLSLRAQRQQVLASNIANADTPGYKARDFDFAKALDGALGHGEGHQVSKTSVGHLGVEKSVAQGLAEASLRYRTPTQDSIDGNTVDMDRERAEFADNSIRYEAAVNSATSKVRTLLSAIQG